MFICTGYAAQSADAPLAPFTFNRRDPGPSDVEIEILFCGVCHSDLHTNRNEWHNSVFPTVTGHEIVGRVTRVGAGVTRFKAGDMAGVGCLVDSCRSCDSCQRGLEQYCLAGPIGTYNAPDKHTGGMTYGGYSKAVVVDQAFVLHIPEGLDPAAAAPLLCAGITTFSPLRHWKIGPGMTIGVVGLGGLGHMGVKLAHAMGAKVVLYTTSAGKRDDGLRLGAHDVVVTREPGAFDKWAGKLDFVLDCVSADHDINAYLGQLKLEGTLCIVGAPENPQPIAAFSLIPFRRSFAGSTIGGILETQEMLDFCAAHGITADIEIIAMHEINDAYERILKSDVKYRFVIDMATLEAA